MRCAVCTLFEGDYHLGAAVLINSLVRAGFAGTVHAGFRGPLPAWAERQVRALNPGEWEMQVTPEIRLRLITIKSEGHLTNLKPDFLLDVERAVRAETDALLFFDADLAVNIEWSYIEEWLSCGVTLCEDVNSPLAENHPKRVGWRRFFTDSNLRFRGREYANGGFVGLDWKHRRLLEVWRDMLVQIGGALGGRDVVGIEGGRRVEKYGFANCFNCTDQDALNAALEALPEIPVSFLGRQAMGFEAGRLVLPHALSPPKPWQRRYLRDAFAGIPPSAVDKVFWKQAEGALQPFAPGRLESVRRDLALASGIGRFYRRT